MLCKVDGCGKEAMYARQCVCQKHYFRFMRTGSYELQELKRRMKSGMTLPQALFARNPTHPKNYTEDGGNTWKELT